MEGLRTTRVLVVDDSAEEADGILKALAKEGIGAVSYSQKLDLLPQRPLTGIRLAVLDMNLENIDASDAAAIVAPTLGVLQRLVSGENGPYVAIAWTKHPDLISEFETRVLTLPCSPIKLIPLLKADVRKKSGEFDFRAIGKRLASALDDCYPISLLGFWEQMVHDSTGEIIETVSPANDWPEQSRKTLKTLLRESSAENDPQDVKLRALLETLNFLQLDVVETKTALLDVAVANRLVGPLKAVVVPKSGPAELAARLNRRLMFGRPLPGAAPGNIYEPSRFRSVGRGTFPSLDELLDDMVNPGKKEEVSNLGCIPLVLEITPICDHQHGKTHRGRFICGIAIPPMTDNDYKKRFKPADYIRKGPVVGFEQEPLNGNRVTLWNSHYIISLPPGRVPRNRALLRLRQSPLIDVQAWAGSHASRPGYLSVH